MKKLFTNGKVVVEDDVLSGVSVCVKDGVIAGFLTDYTPNDFDEVIDCKGNYILPGFIDIHVHGGGGFDFMDGSVDDFKGVVDSHLKHGTTTIYPTTMSADFSEILSTISVYREYKKTNPIANVMGLHLEGPFLNKKMCGAQRLDLIIPPTQKEIDLLKQNVDVIDRITCAPEVDGVLNLYDQLAPFNVQFSMGHTLATFTDAEIAYKKGFSSITHLYSATSGFFKVNQKVHIGVTQYAYAEQGIYAELIADGCHVPKELLRLVAKIKGVDKVCLVTDAMRASCTNVTESFLGKKVKENAVIIEDGVAKLPDRSFFAGSIGTMDRAVRFAVKNCGFAIFDALKMASLTPAKLMQIDSYKGSIKLGKDADFVITDYDINVKNVYIKGEKAV